MITSSMLVNFVKYSKISTDQNLADTFLDLQAEMTNKVTQQDTEKGNR